MEKQFYGAVYSDLACERRRTDTEIAGVEYSKEQNIIGTWEKIKITSPEGAKSIGRPMGLYDTLTTDRMDLLNFEEIMGAKEELAAELCEMVEKSGTVATNLIVIGLGNQKLTPDAIGPETADRIRATMHISRLDETLFSTLGCSKISVLKPGVTAQSGLESGEVLRGISEIVKPDIIIAVDSLRAASRTRLGNTFQISNTGIIPGSGLGNSRDEISEKTLGVPIISIGVPTIIDSRSLCTGEDERSSAKRTEGMMVSPKEISEIVENAAEIISGAINLAFGICG